MPGSFITFLAAAAIVAAVGPETTPPAPAPRPAVTIQRPIAFEASTDPNGVRYVARAADFQLRLSARGMVVARGRDAVSLSFAGAASNPRMIPIDRLPGGTNYLIGNDRTKWRLGVPSFGKVRVENLYRGVDMLVYANDRELEYDLIVQPGVDPGAIRLLVKGAGDLRVVDGDLVGRTRAGEFRLRRPVVYQAAAGGRRPVDGRYRVNRGGIVTFELGSYDRSQPLVIDPVVVYATLFGGVHSETSVSSQMVAVDGTGAAYLTGNVDDAALVTKIAPDGASVLYTTLLSGTAANAWNSGHTSQGYAVAVDAAGNAYVAGSTLAADFPVTPGTYTNPHNQATMFLAKLDPNGALAFSTIWGNDKYDFSGDVALDAAGNIFVAGRTCSAPSIFPITAGAAQPTTTCVPNAIRHPDTDAFVVKFNPTATAVLYGTYLGGHGVDQAHGIAVDAAGAAWVTGRTVSEDFPLAAAVQVTRKGESDVFVAKIAPNGASFLFSTYLGSSSDELLRPGTLAPNSVAVDAAGNAYVTGTTEGQDFPTTAGAYRTEKPPYPSVFVTKFSPAADMAYSTFVSSGIATGIAVDAAGRAHVVGSTGVANLPVTADATQPTLGGSDDGFLTVLSADGSAVEYSTYIGGPAYEYTNGVALGTNGSVYIGGQTWGPGFPTTSGVLKPSYTPDGADFFIVRMQFTQPDTTAPVIGDVADITVETDSTAGAIVTFALPAATDDTDPAPIVEADPPSGSLFPVGTTTVTVTATDSTGNASEKTFTVTVVLSPTAMITALIDESAAFGQGGTLLRNARQNIATGDLGAACNQLNAFMNQLRAQRGKSVTAAQADAWTAKAAAIRLTLGCQ